MVLNACIIQFILNPGMLVEKTYHISTFTYLLIKKKIFLRISKDNTFFRLVCTISRYQKISSNLGIF